MDAARLTARGGSASVVGCRNAAVLRRFHVLRAAAVDATTGVIAGSQHHRTSSKHGSSAWTDLLVHYHDASGTLHALVVHDSDGATCERVPLLVVRRLPTLAERGPAPAISAPRMALAWTLVALGLAIHILAVATGRRP